MSIHQLFKGGAVSGPVDEAIGGAQSVAELVTRHLPRVNNGFALLPWTVHAHSTEALIEQQLRLKVADYRAGVLSPSLSTFVLNLVNASRRLCDRLSVREVHQSMAVPYLCSFVRSWPNSLLLLPSCSFYTCGEFIYCSTNRLCISYSLMFPSLSPPLPPLSPYRPLRRNGVGRGAVLLLGTGAGRVRVRAMHRTRLR